MQGQRQGFSWPLLCIGLLVKAFVGKLSFASLFLTPESLTLLDSSTPPLEWNQYKVENALIGPVGSFCILWQFNQNQFSKFPAGMWLNYSAIGLFERGREGTRWRKYFLLFHLLRTAGSSIFLSYLFRWHFCGTQEHFNHITRTLFLLETVGWAWSEYPFSHAAHPADCD